MDHCIAHPELFAAPLEITTYKEMPFKPSGCLGLWMPRVGLGHMKIWCAGKQ